jgi:hypothetical protein
MNTLARLLILLILGVLSVTPLRAQTQGGAKTKVKPLPPVEGLVKNVYFLPYLTGSLNLQSGKVFLRSATGIGYGFGVAFDLTEDGQKTGFYFDFAYQDMRAAAEEGTCMNDRYDTLLTNARAEHYYQYVVFEPFLKLQGAKANGYFLLGTSIGYNLKALTVARGEVREEFSDWTTSEQSSPHRSSGWPWLDPCKIRRSTAHPRGSRRLSDHHSTQRVAHVLQ